MRNFYSIFSSQGLVGLAYRNLTSLRPHALLYRVYPTQIAYNAVMQLPEYNDSSAVEDLRFHGADFTDNQSNMFYNLFYALQEFGKSHSDIDTEFVGSTLGKYILANPYTQDYPVNDLLAVFDYLLTNAEFTVPKYTYYINNLNTLNYLFRVLNQAQSRFDLEMTYSGDNRVREQVAESLHLAQGTAELAPISQDLLSVLYKASIVDIDKTLKGFPLLYILAVAKKCNKEGTAKNFVKILKNNFHRYSEYVSTYLYV